MSGLGHRFLSKREKHGPSGRHHHDKEKEKVNTAAYLNLSMSISQHQSTVAK